MRDEYSPFKIVHHLDKISALKSGEQIVPVQVQLVPSNVCNKRCSFCTYRMKGYVSNQLFDEKKMLTKEKIFECLADFSAMGVKAVHYTGGGEPTVHPDILSVINETLEKGLDLALVSNGLALTEDLCKILGYAKWTRISIDSASQEVYSLIGDISANSFVKLMKNIRLLLKYKKDCIVGFGFVVNRENYTEIFEAAKLAKDLGFDNFRISGAFTTMGYKYFNTFVEEATDLAKEAEDLSDKNFTVFNLFNDRMEDLFVTNQDYNFCPVKELLTFIGGDGNVYTCCTLAYSKRGLIGSIQDQTFRELWESVKKFKLFNEHDPQISCRHFCMYRKKNNFINYCIKRNPKHTNFI